MEKEDPIDRVRNFDELKRKLRRYGITDSIRISAAAYLLDQIAGGTFASIPVEIKGQYETAAKDLISAGLITEDASRLTEYGWRVYNFLQ